MSRLVLQARDGGEFQAELSLPNSGGGPGIVLLQEIFGINHYMRDVAAWYAERGFVVICPDLFWRQQPGVELDDRKEEDWERAFELYQGLDEALAIEDAAVALACLRRRPEVSGGVGAVGFCLGGKLAYLLAARHEPDCVVGYYGVGIEHALGEAGEIASPLLLHMAGKDSYCTLDAQGEIHQVLDAHAQVTLQQYPEQEHAFARPGGEHHAPAAAELADLRSFEFLARHLGLGTDTTAQRLSELWERHIDLEFATKDAEQTLTTMVDDAYVNHIPTLTGGVGRDALLEFYGERFIPQMPPDTEMTPVSRTIGRDQLVDEMVFKFTHTIEMDWMLPGIPPTGKAVQVPLVVIVHFREGKLAHEHIYWDQASVLVQLGLLDTEGLPVLGAETARKVMDAGSVPSNALIERADRRRS